MKHFFSLLLILFFTISALGQNSLGDLNVILKCDFENNTLGNYLTSEYREDWNAVLGSNSRCSIERDGEDTENPSKVLRISFPANSLGPSEGGTQWHSMLGKIYNEIYLSYDIYFMPGFQYQLGGKLPSLQAGVIEGGGDFNRPSGFDGFTGGMMFGVDGKLKFYPYFADSYQDVYGDTYVWGNKYSETNCCEPSKIEFPYTSGKIAYVTPGKWHNITYRMVSNTVYTSGSTTRGNYDGILEAYFDGVLVTQASNILFRHTDKIGIDRFRMVTFFGGSTDDWRNPIDEWLQVDNVIMYTFKDTENVPKGNILSPTNRTINYWRMFSTLATNPPAAPTALTISSLTKSSIGLKWTDNAANEQGFRIYRSTTSTGTFTEIGAVKANITTFSDNSLQPGTTYYYRVRAYNVAGYSKYSAILTTATVALQIPAAPSALLASDTAKNSISLKWTDNSTNEQGFRIYRSTSSSSGFSQIFTVAANITAYTDNSLQPGTAYYYQLSAYNADGESANSSVLSTATLALQPPASPTTLSSATQTKNTITLSWIDNASNEQGFSLWRSVTSSQGFSEIASLPANAITFTDSSLQPATTYYYQIRAYNQDGYSSYTSVFTVTTLTLQIPAAPAGLIASQVSYTSAVIVWADKSGNETAFYMERSGPNDFTIKKMLSLPSNTVSFSDTALTMNSSYQYRIRAKNDDGVSAWSNVIDIVTPSILPPAAPTKLKSTEFTDKSISITWNDNSGNEDAFVISRSLAADMASTVDITIHANDTAFTDTNLVASTTYMYTIKAVNRGGNSLLSNRNAATTLSLAELKRVKDGLVAYYNFGYNPDYIIYDQSGYGEPVNLNVLNRSAIVWNKDNTIDIQSNTALVSISPATKITHALKSTNELTFECWIKPMEPDFSANSRIVSFAGNDAEVGFLLDQVLSGNPTNQSLTYSIRMQTESTNPSGYPEFIPDLTQPYINLQHLLYERDSLGKETLYLNGVKSSEGFRPSNLGTWKDDFYLRLGNESDMNHAWKGSFYSVAIYNKALSQTEIMTNYNAGPCDSIENFAVDYQVEVYPNPVSDRATVKITFEEITDFMPQTSLQIVDIFEKVIYRESVFNPNSQLTKSIDLSHIPEGIYFLQVFSGKKQKATKIVVQR